MDGQDGQDENQQVRQKREKTNIRNYETRETHEKNEMHEKTSNGSESIHHRPRVVTPSTLKPHCLCENCPADVLDETNAGIGRIIDPFVVENLSKSLAQEQISYRQSVESTVVLFGDQNSLMHGLRN